MGDRQLRALKVSELVELNITDTHDRSEVWRVAAMRDRYGRPVLFIQGRKAKAVKIEDEGLLGSRVIQEVREEDLRCRDLRYRYVDPNTGEDLYEGDDEMKTTFPSGATRSSNSESSRYDLIPPGPLRRLAQRYGMGVASHGERNWEKGLPTSSTLNHLYEHLAKWRDGDREEDHLAAVAWGVFALMFFEEKSAFLGHALSVCACRYGGICNGPHDTGETCPGVPLRRIDESEFCVECLENTGIK